MTFVNANYLTEIIGDVRQMECKGFVLYSEKLKKEIVVPIEVYNALDGEVIRFNIHCEQQTKGVDAEFLSEVVGDVTQLEPKGFILYSEKLGKTILVPIEVHNALEDEAEEVERTYKALKEFTYQIVEEMKEN